jgi:hypothetical protein
MPVKTAQAGLYLKCKKRLLAFDAQPFFFARVFMRGLRAMNKTAAVTANAGAMHALLVDEIRTR